MADGDPTVESLTAELKEAKDRLSEFRDNNVKHKEALEKFEGIDVDEYRELKSAKDALERKELIKAGDVETAIDAALEKQKADFDKRLEAVQGENTTLQADLRTLRVTDRLKVAAADAGARSEAVEDLIKSVSDQFEIVDGELVHQSNGSPTLSKAKAGENMGPEEFFTEHAVSKPFFYGASGGGGGEETRKVTGSKRMISKEEFQSGRFNEQVKKGEVEVEGYQDAVA